MRPIHKQRRADTSQKCGNYGGLDKIFFTGRRYSPLFFPVTVNSPRGALLSFDTLFYSFPISAAQALCAGASYGAGF